MNRALPPRPAPPVAPVDPLLYAASLNAFVTERNPIHILVGDMVRLIKTVVNLGQTRKIAQQRIHQLQNQVHKLERDMAQVSPKTVGNRLDKLR